jgi:hypothetical protein
MKHATPTRSQARREHGRPPSIGLSAPVLIVSVSPAGFRPAGSHPDASSRQGRGRRTLLSSFIV